MSTVTDFSIQDLFAERIGGKAYGKSTAIYKFQKIKNAKQDALAANPDKEIIDFGVGEPDAMAFPEIVKIMQEETAKPENRTYADNGVQEFKDAAVQYMNDVFSVNVDATSEVIHAIGSKAALTLVPACFINPGDITLMTVPGYPVLGTHSKYYGGEVYNLPLEEENDFLPKLDKIPEDVARRAKLLYLNYPNNPTGGSATPEFFANAIEFARNYNVIILHDAAYAPLIFEGKPLSILSIDGGKDVAIELHSLSKGYNMTGWRLGFVAGNPLAVKAYGDVKDNSDSGQFMAIQKAGAYALAHPEITEQIAAKYSRRMDLLVETLRSFGFNARKPKGSFFLYLRCPKGTKDGATFKTAEEFSDWLIRKKLISTVPWDDVGAYVRFSVTFAAQGEDREKMIMQEISSRLDCTEFEF